jgi:hypothetical protein
MTTQRVRLFVSFVLSIFLAVTVTAVAPNSPDGPGATSPMVLPAGAFASDGDEAFGYYIPGEFISGGTNVRLRAPIYLPARAYVTDFMVVARDQNAASNGYFYLREAPFGTIGDSNVISTIQTTGSDSGLQYPADYSVDRSFDPANNIYWVEASLPADDIYLYSVHIHYIDAALFVDGFEIGNSSRWSSELTLKSIAIDDWTPVTESTEVATKAIPEWMDINDVEVREALKSAMEGTRGFGSPLVVPGGAFKTVGGVDFDDYYISGIYGFVYARPDLRAELVAPFNLPQGATITHFMLFYRDSNPTEDIYFSLSRMNTWDGTREDLLYDSTSGSSAAMRSAIYTSSSLTTAVIDNTHFSHWITVNVEGYQFAEDYWHEVHAFVVLYTVP